MFEKDLNKIHEKQDALLKECISLFDGLNQYKHFDQNEPGDGTVGSKWIFTRKEISKIRQVKEDLLYYLDGMMRIS